MMTLSRNEYVKSAIVAIPIGGLAFLSFFWVSIYLSHSTDFLKALLLSAICLWVAIKTLSDLGVRWIVCSSFLYFALRLWTIHLIAEKITWVDNPTMMQKIARDMLYYVNEWGFGYFAILPYDLYFCVFC